MRSFLAVLLTFSVFPVFADDAAAIRAVIDAYFTAKQRQYPPGDRHPAPQDAAQRAAGREARALWQLRKGDPDLPAGRSDLFVRVYRPAGWEVYRLRSSGDFARARVRVIVGDPVKKRLNHLEHEVQYSLVRKAGRWYLTGFRDLDAEAAGKRRKDALETDAARAEALPPPPRGGTPAEVVEAYLQALQRLLPPSETRAPLALVHERTSRYWRFKEKRHQGRAAGFVGLFSRCRPARWRVDAGGMEADQADIGVALQCSATGDASRVVFRLTRHEGQWRLTAFRPLARAAGGRPPAVECAELADRLEACQPYRCAFTHPFTGARMQREVKGMAAGKCVYEEQMPGRGRMGCHYTPQQARAVARYYRSFMGSQRDVSVTVEMGPGASKTTRREGGEIVNNPLQAAMADGTCVVSGY